MKDLSEGLVRGVHGFETGLLRDRFTDKLVELGLVIGEQATKIINLGYNTRESRYVRGRTITNSSVYEKVFLGLEDK